MNKNLWIPGIDKAKDKVLVDIKSPRVVPDERKREGGTWFDDEMETFEEKAAQLAKETKNLINHLNARPDHVVYVGDTKTREQLRSVFNWWKREGALTHNPNIRIDYGVVEGAIRVGEDRE